MLSIHRLWRANWDPWAADWPEQYHAHGWPADFSGVVWMKILPASPDQTIDLSVDIEWGPWGRHVDCAVTPAGIVLLTGKAKDRDGVSRTLNFTADQKVFVLFGAGGDLAGEEVIDIKRGWELRNTDARGSEHAYGPERQ